MCMFGVFDLIVLIDHFWLFQTCVYSLNVCVLLIQVTLVKDFDEIGEIS